MTGVPKPKPREAFEANMADAHHLVMLSEGLTNTRVRRMRKERRERVGEAWDVPAKQWDELDCVESQDLFLTFKPGSRLTRESFDDHRPLLRQALVAACAATETYLADKVMERLSDLTTSADAATGKIRRLGLTVGDWLYIEQHYQRRRAGLHRVIENQVRQKASTAPSRVSELLSLIGVNDPHGQLDQERNVIKGETCELLDRVTSRRNRIVHTGDRQGRSRAQLTIDEVRSDLGGLESVVDAIESIL